MWRAASNCELPPVDTIEGIAQGPDGRAEYFLKTGRLADLRALHHLNGGEAHALAGVLRDVVAHLALGLVRVRMESAEPGGCFLKNMK